MSIINNFSFWGNRDSKPNPAGKQKNQNKPSIPQDKVDISNGKNDTVEAAGVKDGTNVQVLTSDVAKEKGISLENIDTPLEAAVTPLADPGFLSAVAKAIMGGKVMSATGTIRQGDKKYDVELNLSNNNKPETSQQPDGIIMGHNNNSDKEFKHDYQLTGKIGDMKMDVHCYSSGLSLFLNGSIGNNPVKIKNSYKILSGKIKTKGKIGKIPLKIESKGKEIINVKGSLGGVKFNQKLCQVSGGATCEGRVGDFRTKGSSKETKSGQFISHTNVDGVSIDYEINVA
ncbi:MAG: hypothetical protein K8T10_17535 [Candidatus Eremiobacteraeota bacterium]|nr:hypothetical protein [Candidatus Eremiobacteraeota bacterium]